MQYLKLTENQVEEIIKEESKKLVGTCLKRIEIPMEIKESSGKECVLNKEELQNLKSQLKNLVYESMRNIKDIFLRTAKNNCDILLINKDEQSKER